MTRNNGKMVKDLLDKINNIERELSNIKFQIFKSGMPYYYLRLPILRIKEGKKKSIIEKTAGSLKSKVELEEITKSYEEHLFQAGLGK